ncbi:4-(cytidine 5'-diphospho)-2-C-methyl-D-erythritol kinase [Terrimonas sp. NA20]|uniref:4-diphosphocytidyl-2-C-methyl-D-erythritol kinase n=1 Tax=Terrimonas ginsenosidimutans TaxID=2908004 RepID=A0ABS9KXQ1_9BACT|nr:4-(cytidine 5'-diphospho)-2-C-methyl-D-erythritol kinase [Terrimonas ginsenosidimutans]
MVVFPNAKINLGLRITEKRNDGYHELETCFYPLPVFDALEIIRLPAVGSFRFNSSGLDIAGELQDNLCVKAYSILKADFPGLPPVSVFLQKAIPSGAGLGGGSADASFTLKLLNQLGGLNLSVQQLLDYSLRLGSDCPFFIINKPCYATGRGEVLEPVAIDLSAFGFVVINPGIHVPTGQAFSWLTPAKPKESIRDLIHLPVEKWKDVLINDFEKSVVTRHPEVGQVKDLLYRSGAVYASMSGSGSTVYGLFPNDHYPVISVPEHYLIRYIGFK